MYSPGTLAQTATVRQDAREAMIPTDRETLAQILMGLETLVAREAMILMGQETLARTILVRLDAKQVMIPSDQEIPGRTVMVRRDARGV